jgi:hypothetical protein
MSESQGLPPLPSPDQKFLDALQPKKGDSKATEAFKLNMHTSIESQYMTSYNANVRVASGQVPNVENPQP